MAESPQYDFLVIGSGLAGLAFALKAAQHGKVCVLTKGEVTDSNTSYAQGGIAAAVGEADDWKLHEEDTLIAGDGLCKKEAVRFLVQRAPEAIQWLIDLGANFDVQLGGELALGREGGHSRNRIVHHADNTGWEIERAVAAAVRGQKNITVTDHAFATSLLIENGRCVGVEVFIEGLGLRRFQGRAVMLATGGCGRMYRHTTNPAVATGDGIALAAQAGAQIEGMEFMQFHPTTLYHPQMRSFLITEAVRGAGATLRNHLGRRFMYDYDPRLELAPRDVVSRAIHAEMERLGTWCVYLDAAHLDPHSLQEEFPNIWEKLRTIEVEMEKDWIPVVPAQHYSCGGVVTDLDGRTNVPGLYAAGEVTSTGVHGANRLASNSLLEALVFASSAAEAVRSEPATESINPQSVTRKAIVESEAVRIRRALGRIMTERVGIVRTDAGLQEARSTVAALRKEYDQLPNAPLAQYPLETENLLIAAQFVVEEALARRENVGLHYNTDLPTKKTLSNGATGKPQATASPTMADPG